jgi:hypothetical protein
MFNFNAFSISSFCKLPYVNFSEGSARHLCSSHLTSKLNLRRIFHTLQSPWVLQIRLLPHLIHSLHYHNTLLPRQPVAFQFPISNTPRAFIRFIEHAMAISRSLGFKRLILPIRKLTPRRILCRDDRVRCRSENVVHSHLAECALDAYRVGGRMVCVWIRSDAEVGRGDAVGALVGEG